MSARAETFAWARAALSAVQGRGENSNDLVMGIILLPIQAVRDERADDVEIGIQRGGTILWHPVIPVAQRVALLENFARAYAHGAVEHRKRTMPSGNGEGA